MRLLAVNPNTSPEVTAAYLAEAQRVAPAGVGIVGVTGRFGALIVSTEAENLIAAHSALDLIARHADSFDGVILAISFDTALRAAEELLPVPVVGITHAASRAAASGGRPFGAVLFGGASRPLYARLLDGYGLAPVAWECVEIASSAEYLDPTGLDRQVLVAIDRLAARGAEAALICGAAIVGMAARLQSAAPVPLYDGASAVMECAARVAAGERKPPRPRTISGTAGLSEDLAALISGDWPPRRVP